MPIEIQYLIYSSLFGITQIFAQAFGVTLLRGVKWNMGARDNTSPIPPGSKAARLDRALQNFKETFPLFVAGVFVAFGTDSFDSNTALAAQLYFWARVAYAIVYFFGISYIRTAIWGVSIVGIAMLLLSPF